MRNLKKDKKYFFTSFPRTTIFILAIILTFALDFVLTNIYNKLISDQRRSIRIGHPVFHHTFKKNSKNHEVVYKNKFTLFTNSLGFKDRSIRTIQLVSTKHRILFIGDSFTEGIGLSYEDTFVGMIDSRLSKNNIEVLNASRVSYSPIIYWRKIKFLIEDLGLDIDELVVFLDISDVKDEVTLYKLSENMNVITRNVVAYESATTKNIDYIYLLKKFFHTNTTVYFFILNLVYDGLGFKQETKKPNVWSNYISLDFDTDKWTLNNEVYDKYGKDGVASMKKYMNKLLKLTKEHKIDLTIAVYPYVSQIWYNDLKSMHVQIWKEWSKKNQIKFINYFPDFFSEGLSSSEKIQLFKKYYLPGDVHYNKEGNTLIADKFLKTYLNQE